MKNTDLAVIALVAAAVVFEAVALVLRAVLAHLLALLLTVAGWKPTSPAPLAQQQATSAITAPFTAAGQKATPEPQKPQLAALPVRELRQLARAAGHRALARNGRRVQLLEVLA